MDDRIRQPGGSLYGRARRYRVGLQAKSALLLTIVIVFLTVGGGWFYFRITEESLRSSDRLHASRLAEALALSACDGLQRIADCRLRIADCGNGKDAPGRVSSPSNLQSETYNMQLKSLQCLVSDLIHNDSVPQRRAAGRRRKSRRHRRPEGLHRRLVGSGVPAGVRGGHAAVPRERPDAGRAGVDPRRAAPAGGRIGANAGGHQLHAGGAGPGAAEPDDYRRGDHRRLAARRQPAGLAGGDPPGAHSGGGDGPAGPGRLQRPREVPGRRRDFGPGGGLRHDGGADRPRPGGFDPVQRAVGKQGGPADAGPSGDQPAPSPGDGREGGFPSRGQSRPGRPAAEHRGHGDDGDDEVRRGNARGGPPAVAADPGQR